MNRTSRVFEIGEQRREIAGLGDHRAGGGAEIDAEFARHDLRQRGLAEAGRADEQHVVERFLARARRLDEDREISARLLLADEFGEPLRPQRGVRVIVARFGGDEAARGGAHRASSLSPWRIKLRGLGALARIARRRPRSRRPPAAGRSRD